MQVFGILNITKDSFFDGGKYYSFSSAIEKANKLIEEGSDILDIGAQASNPTAKILSIEEEWYQLSPILDYCMSEGYKVSIDTYKAPIIQKCLEKKVSYINNINSFRDPESLEILSHYRHALPKLILMFSHNNADIATIHSSLNLENILDRILFFFDNKVNQLRQLGIPESKLIFDPGMGFFLGTDPRLSIYILKNIKYLQKKLGKVMVSVSRKSFIGKILGDVSVDKRGTGTLTCEMFAYLEGVDYIRTHEVRQLLDSIQILEYIKGVHCEAKA